MITIVDPGQTLTTSQAEALTAKAAAYPFDLHVLIATGGASRAAFEHQVADYVPAGSRMVSIGVDPTHHYSFVHSSGALGVPAGPQVAKAGNAFFRAGNLVDGIDAIAAKANDLRVETHVIQSQTGAPIVIHEHHTADGVWWTLGAAMVLAVAVVAWAVWRARRRERLAAEAERERDTEAAELRARNIEEASWHDSMAARRRSSRPASAPTSTPAPAPSYRPSPSYAPVPTAPPAPIIINQGHSSGLDMLLGYELGRDSNRAPAVIERETVIERDSGSSSGSSWGDSDSSSSSSWDSGGSDSSSSFDSGSSDSGSGGGSDW